MWWRIRKKKELYFQIKINENLIKIDWLVKIEFVINNWSFILLRRLLYL